MLEATKVHRDEAHKVHVGRSMCPFCFESVTTQEPAAACGGCLTWIHDACLAEHAACPACGSASRLLRAVAAPPLASRPARPFQTAPRWWNAQQPLPLAPCRWCQREHQPARNAVYLRPYCSGCVNRLLVWMMTLGVVVMGLLTMVVAISRACAS